MTAVDSNVLVRVLTADDPHQTAAARKIFSADIIWIARTVLLETAWVLRSRHGFEDDAIAEAFTKLIGLDNVQVEDEGAIAAAFSLISHGIDVADALHLSSRPPGSTFVSFDRAFVLRAQRAAVSDVVSVPQL
jgi:predicted nucleic-acid-binding protein